MKRHHNVQSFVIDPLTITSNVPRKHFFKMFSSNSATFAPELQENILKEYVFVTGFVENCISCHTISSSLKC